MTVWYAGCNEEKKWAYIRPEHVEIDKYTKK
jgi:hypothetical protein